MRQKTYFCVRTKRKSFHSPKISEIQNAIHFNPISVKNILQNLNLQEFMVWVVFGCQLVCDKFSLLERRNLDKFTVE